MKDKVKILEDFQELTWVMKDGTKEKIKNLKLSHLFNIIKYLKRNFDSMEDLMNDYPSFDGEMAQMYAEQQWSYAIKEYNRIKRTIELFDAYYKLKNL